MNYKLIILSPSCGGKSSLMRYLREHTDLHIAETDEEVMKANNGVWPDDELKNKVLVPNTTNEIITRENVIYFASYIPTELLQKAKKKGFKIIVLETPLEVLNKRNTNRMKVEGYDDVSQWFKGQLDNYQSLAENHIVDQVVNGNQTVEKVADEVKNLTQ
jgi:guanylate kinase